MNDIIKELIAMGANITLKANKTRTIVIVRMPDNEVYKATGPSVDVALDRCLEKTEKHAKNVKRLRRQKERERQDIIDSMEEDDSGEETPEEWNNRSTYREKLDWD